MELGEGDPVVETCLNFNLKVLRISSLDWPENSDGCEKPLVSANPLETVRFKEHLHCNTHTRIVCLLILAFSLPLPFGSLAELMIGVRLQKTRGNLIGEVSASSPGTVCFVDSTRAHRSGKKTHQECLGRHIFTIHAQSSGHLARNL